MTRALMLDILSALSPWDAKNAVTYAGVSSSALVSLLPSADQLKYAVLALTAIWLVVQIVHRFRNWKK